MHNETSELPWDLLDCRRGKRRCLNVLVLQSSSDRGIGGDDISAATTAASGLSGIDAPHRINQTRHDHPQPQNNLN